MLKTRFVRIMSTIFTPPFRGLSGVIWLYFVLCFLLQPQTQIINGDLPDPDDYLYLTQAVDLLHGQNWFDLVQHRMDPAIGTYISFAHILCLFYAGLIYALSPLLGTIGAATITAAFVPLFYFALFLATIRWAARPFINPSWVGVTAYVTLFATTLTFQFTPGHIVPNGLEALLGIVAFGACIRMIEAPSIIKWPLITGFFLALGMAIGLEMLPLLLLLSLCVATWNVSMGRESARAGFLFGLALFLTSAGFLFLAKMPDHLLENDLKNHSITYVALTGGIAVYFTTAGIAGLFPRLLRYAVNAICAAVIGFAYLTYFIALKNGIATGEELTLTSMLSDNISGTTPIFGNGEPLFSLASYLIWPLMAIIPGCFFLWKSEKQSRWPWGMLMAVLIGLTGLMLFYQDRLLIPVQAFCIIPLALFLQKGWEKARYRYADSGLWSARLGLVLLVGPLPMVFLPALADSRPFNTGVLLFSNETANAEKNSQCEEQPLADMLNLPSYYGDRPRIIMNMFNDGPELLFRTNDGVLAGRYPGNTNGNADSIKFFSTTDPREAESIARRDSVDLIVMCKSLAPIYTMPSADKGGKVRLGATEEAANPNLGFAQQLVNGTIPDWLKPIKFPLFKNMMLFEVLPEQP